MNDGAIMKHQDTEIKLSGIVTRKLATLGVPSRELGWDPSGEYTGYVEQPKEGETDPRNTPMSLSLDSGRQIETLTDEELIKLTWEAWRANQGHDLRILRAEAKRRGVHVV